MKLLSSWPFIVLLLANAILGVRLMRTITQSTTGWEPHFDQWKDIATGLVGMERTALTDKEPEMQARFWLNEVAQMKEVDNDPQLAMGAAWMLDAPQFGFIRQHVGMKGQPDIPGLPASWRRELDNDAINVLAETFESLCRDECLNQIETAIRLDSDNVEVWRQRALLLFQTSYMGSDMQPRRDDWLSVLDECAKHDPNNALYDYLAALQLWTSAAEYGWEDGGETLTLKDEEAFHQADVRFSAGLAKPHLKFGDAGYPATMAFLSESSINRPDHLTAAGSRQIDKRARNLMTQIARWQGVRLGIKKQEGKLEAAVVAARKVLRVSDQVTESGNHPSLTGLKLFLRQWSLRNLQSLNRNHPSLLDADESETVARQYGKGQLDSAVLEEVGKRTNVVVTTSNIPNLILTTFLMATAQMLIVVLLAMSLLSGLLALLFGKVSSIRVGMGWLRHIAVWLIAIGGSFVILGMCPAEIVSPTVQTWSVRAILEIGFAATTFGLLFLVRKRFTMRGAVFIVLAATMLLPIVAGVGMISSELEVKSWISPTLWEETAAIQITPSELQSAMQLSDSKWTWALIQWQAHHGALACPLIAAGMLLLWDLIRQIRRFSGGYREILRSHKRSQIRRASHVVTRSCVVASLVLSLVYLSTAPIVAHSMETHHQVYHERLINPLLIWNEIEVVTAQVESDDSLMAKLKAEIAERNREIAEQEEWADD
jgi:hypothetical protein